MVPSFAQYPHILEKEKPNKLKTAHSIAKKGGHTNTSESGCVYLLICWDPQITEEWKRTSSESHATTFWGRFIRVGGPAVEEK